MRVIARAFVASDADGVGVARSLRDLRRVYTIHADAIIAYRSEHTPLASPTLTRARKKLQLRIIDGMFHT